VIRNKELDDSYKYLDREESDGIENSQMKDKLVGNITVESGKFSRWSKTQRTRKTIKKQKFFNYRRNPPPEDRHY
jgi:hypothetical protein